MTITARDVSAWSEKPRASSGSPHSAMAPHHPLLPSQAHEQTGSEAEHPGLECHSHVWWLYPLCHSISPRILKSFLKKREKKSLKFEHHIYDVKSLSLYELCNFKAYWLLVCSLTYYMKMGNTDRQSSTYKFTLLCKRWCCIMPKAAVWNSARSAPGRQGLKPDQSPASFMSTLIQSMHKYINSECVNLKKRKIYCTFSFTYSAQAALSDSL